jgi:hypothetical protein
MRAPPQIPGDVLQRESLRATAAQLLNGNQLRSGTPISPYQKEEGKITATDGGNN